MNRETLLIKKQRYRLYHDGESWWLVQRRAWYGWTYAGIVLLKRMYPTADEAILVARVKLCERKTPKRGPGPEFVA
jgi:hypothetical protein